MALHDFRCPACGAVASDVNVPISMGARAAGIYCRATVHPAPVRMDWIPQIGRMDALEPFQKFQVTETVRGRDITTTIDSLHALRKMERQQEQLGRNGEGRPLIWRDYSQNKSNTDVHTLGKNPADPHGTAEVTAAARKAGTIKGRRGKAVEKAHGGI